MIMRWPSRIGLFKTEVIRQRGPWRGREDVEFATLQWVWWFNRHRLLEPLGYVPPWSTRRHSTAVRRLRISCRHSRNEPSEKPGAVQRLLRVQSAALCP
jgi:hypothetical protein